MTATIETDLIVEPSAAAPAAQPRVSKASLRRLVRDAGGRAIKDAEEGADVLSSFLEALVERSVEAMLFARKRSVALSHVVYAAQTLGAAVPAEVLDAVGSGLQLSRCNARAPAVARKASALSTEIPCATFARVAKSLVLKREKPPRLTAQARKLMHVLSELRVLEAFGRPTEPGPRGDPAERALANAFGCDDDAARSLCKKLAEICDRVPELLKISATKTVNQSTLDLASELPEPRGPAPSARDPAVKIVERLLRGAAVDRRVVAGGAARLVASLRELHGLDAPVLPPSRSRRRRAVQVEAEPMAVETNA